MQARWEHLPTSSPFARGLAIGVDGHFIVEQTARNRSGLPMIFNGSAGIWRKSCIEASGGWAGDTLCEDMDLSLRAAMQGWRCVFVPDVAVPQEEPEHIAHIKSQHWPLGQGRRAVPAETVAAAVAIEVVARAEDGRLDVPERLCRALDDADRDRAMAAAGAAP